MSDLYTQLARQTLEYYLKNGSKPDIKNYPKLLQKKAGVFVSLHKKETDELRGCIGTIFPTQDSLGEEIIENSISAATRDYRFKPVQFDELIDLSVSVDILGEAEQVNSMDDLNPKKYGVIVSTTDGRLGLLLPDLPGVDTAIDQVNIAVEKGGIDLNRDKIILERFEVVRYEE